jgi:hypothetical protein
MDRLAVLDAEFLHLQDRIAHLHIAGVSIFEGPPPSADGIERLLGAKLHLIPRYRQRVRFVPLELGRPVWAVPRIPGARFVTIEKGGHLYLGHHRGSRRHERRHPPGDKARRRAEPRIPDGLTLLRSGRA